MRLSPFRALRPAPGRAAEITSVPYDVVNTREARELAEGRPLSFLRVVRSEIEFPPEADPYADAVYDRARDNLQKYLSEGAYVADEEPAFYVYRINRGKQQQTGLVSAADIDDYFNGLIKKHELTRVEKQRDRTRHIEVTGANTGPVFLTYRDSDSPGLAAFMDALADDAEPLYDVTVEDLPVQDVLERGAAMDGEERRGTRHRMYRLADAGAIEKIRQLADPLKALYIADGHHRAASGADAGQRLRDARGAGSGKESYHRFLVVSFPDNQLEILAYNRAVKDLNGLSSAQFLEKIGEHFAFDEPDAPSLHRFRMYLDGHWHGLVAKQATYQDADETASLDVAILQDHLLRPVLGIEDPRTSDRILFVGGIRGEAELEKLVDSGEYAVAFSLHPVSVGQLLAVADADKIMPPKSTWFEPKLRSGFVVHRIDD